MWALKPKTQGRSRVRASSGVSFVLAASFEGGRSRHSPPAHKSSIGLRARCANLRRLRAMPIQLGKRNRTSVRRVAKVLNTRNVASNFRGAPGVMSPTGQTGQPDIGVPELLGVSFTGRAVAQRRGVWRRHPLAHARRRARYVCEATHSGSAPGVDWRWSLPTHTRRAPYSRP
jgi:hypothetical protein